MKDIYRLKGIQGYFLGFVPYTTAYILSNMSLEFEPKTQKAEIIENIFYGISLLLYNPINIITVRM